MAKQRKPGLVGSGGTGGNFHRPKRKRPTGPPKKKGGGGGGAANDPLYNPLAGMAGKSLKKGVNALTRLELDPALNSYTRGMDAVERDRLRSELGLQQLGERVGGNLTKAYSDFGTNVAGPTSAKMQALSQDLNSRTDQINNQASQNLQGMQTGQLGAITEALKARNVDPGGSASQAALAQQAASQQQTASQNAQAQANFAANQSNINSSLASGLAAATQKQGVEAQSDLASLIASRIAESNASHREDYLDLLGKKSDTESLYGPTRLKNLLSLRQEQQQFQLAAHPPTKKSLVVNKNPDILAGKKVTAGAMAQVAHLQQQAAEARANGNIAMAESLERQARIKAKALKNYGQAVGGGGKKKRRR